MTMPMGDRQMKDLLVEIVKNWSLTTFERGVLRELIHATGRWSVLERARAARLITKYEEYGARTN